MSEEERIIPTYHWVEEELEEGEEEKSPVHRTIGKTMEVTEEFTYFDALKYKMKLEKTIKDKEAEIETLKTMVKAYEEELNIIEDQFDINQEEAKFQLDKHERLKKEEEAKKEEENEKK